MVYGITSQVVKNIIGPYLFSEITNSDYPYYFPCTKKDHLLIDHVLQIPEASHEMFWQQKNMRAANRKHNIIGYADCVSGILLPPDQIVDEKLKAESTIRLSEKDYSRLEDIWTFINLAPPIRKEDEEMRVLKDMEAILEKPCYWVRIGGFRLQGYVARAVGRKSLLENPVGFLDLFGALDSSELGRELYGHSVEGGTINAKKLSEYLVNLYMEGPAVEMYDSEAGRQEIEVIK